MLGELHTLEEEVGWEGLHFSFFFGQAVFHWGAVNAGIQLDLLCWERGGGYNVKGDCEMAR